ncbi:MAG: hypothetical protein ACI8UO_005318 [Verrucomicrobiales bacterium]|jgi:hypothetical protein
MKLKNLIFGLLSCVALLSLGACGDDKEAADADAEKPAADAK